jgi:hypothetical protein
MILTAHEIDYDEGVVIVDSVSDLPLPISTYAFIDVDEADAFLGWALPEHRHELRDEMSAALLVHKWKHSWTYPSTVDTGDVE